MKKLISLAMGFIFQISVYSMPLGIQNTCGVYVVSDDISARPDFEKENKLTVVKAKFTFGKTEQIDNKPFQWFELNFERVNGQKYTAWLLMDQLPSKGTPTVKKYLWHEPGWDKPVAYVNETTGAPVLPRISLWENGFPLHIEGFPEEISFQGWKFSRKQIEQNELIIPEDVEYVKLNPDVMIGFLTEQIDKYGVWKKDLPSDCNGTYQFRDTTEEDIKESVQAGYNLLRLNYNQRSNWVWKLPAFTNNIFSDFKDWPAYLYRSTYWGRAIFVDEPALYYAVIENSKEQNAGILDPSESAKQLEEYCTANVWKQVNNYSAIWINDFIDRRFGRGSLRIVEKDYFFWEVYWQNAWYMMRNPHTVNGFVDEDEGGVDLVKSYNRILGSQIPATTRNGAAIRAAVMRGAARNFNKKWGIAYYGKAKWDEIPEIVRYMYEAGASYFLTWNGWQGGDNIHVPYSFQRFYASLVRQAYNSNPNRDMDLLLKRAKVAVVLPDGFTFFPGPLQHVNWLHLERLTDHGVSYRKILSNAALEVERLLRNGIEFDIAVDDKTFTAKGYDELVYIKTDGTIVIKTDVDSTVLHNPREVLRPSLGKGPHIRILETKIENRVPANIVINAAMEIGTGAAVSELSSDEVLFWEIFTPDNNYFLQKIAKKLEFDAQKGGKYRVRISGADVFGRPCEQWIEFEVQDNKKDLNVFPSSWRFNLDQDNTGYEKGWHTSEFDDSDWVSIPVPSWWDQTKVGLYTGFAWYRVKFKVPEYKGKLQLQFTGIDESCWVYLDGKKIAERSVQSTGKQPHEYWEEPVVIDLSDLEFNSEHSLVVKVHNEKMAGGIYKSVYLYDLYD